MNIGGIEIKVIMGENTPTIVTEALLKLYENNAAKVLDNEIEKNDDSNRL